MMTRFERCHYCREVMDLRRNGGSFVTYCHCCDGAVHTCRPCAKEIVLKDITRDHLFQMDEVPSPRLGALVLEAYSEVVPA